jgi:hypothetical protein
MQTAECYRVVGVRADGSKRLLCGQLTKEEAERLCAALAAEATRPFASLAVEMDDGMIDGSQDV